MIIDAYNKAKPVEKVVKPTVVTEPVETPATQETPAEPVATNDEN